ncbi:MAG TPA: SDR family oxidoreductase [Terriglobales bacterium]|nr:SDR family oxidoreductase [Terriglobales bacterium]
MPVSRPLEGKTALITGAARRIGRSIALALADAGAAIAFSYRGSEAEARLTTEELRARGARVHAFAADLRHPEAAPALVAATVAAFGRLDVLVNNVGRYEAADFDAITDQQWDDMLATNLSAPFRVSREAVPHLRRAAGGRIVHLTSVGAIRAFPTHAHYCASKAGLSHLTRAMARALAPEIQVNAVAPGLIVFGPELTPWEAAMRDRTPLQRAGTPEDVAGAVRYLATCNPFLTGQVLVVDGGLSLM